MTPLQPEHCPDDSIARYTAYRADAPIQIDGDLSKAAWARAPRSTRFVDRTSGMPGWYDTRMACLWDDDYWYIGFWVEEPFLEAHHTVRDSIIFQENDVEVFIDGGDCYYELEINTIGTIYEVFFIWRDAYQRGGRFDVPEFDVFASGTHSFGGDDDRGIDSFWTGTHPRGTRWAFTAWDMPGLKVATRWDGTLNDHRDIDRGWTCEIAIPWASMGWLANGRALPPLDGDVWRAFFARFQKMQNAGATVQPHPAWLLSSHGVSDTHQPACFPYITFADRLPPDEQT
jgi:hypothetical protein